MSIAQTSQDHPRVSVIIPAYNAQAFIAETLKSVLAQTYQNLEVLVVDDGSSDQTAKIVQTFAVQDSRVQLLQQANSGVAAARNLAIQNATGEYIAPIDADDIWYPQNLEKQVQCLMKSPPSVGLCYAWSLDIDENDNLTGGFYNATTAGEVFPTLIYQQFLCNASASVIRRECFEKVGYYNTEMRKQGAQGCEDWDLYLRIAEFYQFQVVPEFLVGYRQTINSMSCNYNTMAKSHQFLIAEIQQRHPEIPASIYRASQSNFYIYLARQSSRGGNHRSTLFWLYQALRFDVWRTTLDHNLYVLGIPSLLKLIAQPVTSLIWPNHLAWLNFIQKKSAPPQPPTLAEIETRMNIHKRLPFKAYERVRLNQWSKNINPSEPI
jgi:glycosyltransferase involved in cell wall biosynthesis